MDGTITVEAGGALTIDAGDGTFTLTDSHVKTDIDAIEELEPHRQEQHGRHPTTLGQGLGHPGKLFVFQGPKHCYRKRRHR